MSISLSNHNGTEVCDPYFMISMEYKLRSSSYKAKNGKNWDKRLPKIIIAMQQNTRVPDIFLFSFFRREKKLIRHVSVWLISCCYLSLQEIDPLGATTKSSFQCHRAFCQKTTVFSRRIPKSKSNTITHQQKVRGFAASTERSLRKY